MTQTATAPAKMHHTELSYIKADAAWRVAQNEATLYFDWEEDAIQCAEWVEAQAIADSLYQIRFRAWSNMAQWRDTFTQAAAAGIRLSLSLLLILVFCSVGNAQRSTSCTYRNEHPKAKANKPQAKKCYFVSACWASKQYATRPKHK